MAISRAVKADSVNKLGDRADEGTPKYAEKLSLNQIVSPTNQ
jgi:hypothetical protein